MTDTKKRIAEIREALEKIDRGDLFEIAMAHEKSGEWLRFLLDELERLERLNEILQEEIQRLRAALEEVHEELKTLHFMIDHDDDIFHERKKKYLSIIDYVGQSVAGQALSTTTEPTNAAKARAELMRLAGLE